MVVSEAEIREKLPSKQIMLKCSKLDPTLTAYLRAYLFATFDLEGYLKARGKLPRGFKVSEPSIVDFELQTLHAYSLFLQRVQ